MKNIGDFCTENWLISTATVWFIANLWLILYCIGTAQFYKMPADLFMKLIRSSNCRIERQFILQDHKFTLSLAIDPP